MTEEENAKQFVAIHEAIARYGEGRYAEGVAAGRADSRDRAPFRLSRWALGVVVGVALLFAVGSIFFGGARNGGKPTAASECQKDASAC